MASARIALASKTVSAAAAGREAGARFGAVSGAVMVQGASKLKGAGDLSFGCLENAVSVALALLQSS